MKADGWEAWDGGQCARVGGQIHRFETPVEISGAVSWSSEKGEKSRIT